MTGNCQVLVVRRESGSKKVEIAKKVRGQVAISSAKVAYQIYKEIFGSSRFKKLADKGARARRLLWACRDILVISQAICLYRNHQKIDGPLFLGMETHALSETALSSALEVLAANIVQVMLAERDEYTLTPAISHAILTYNHGRKTGLADGIVITPSHNPPHDGGFKYNPPNGGPAETDVTDWIEAKSNEFLERGLLNVKRIPFEKAIRMSTTHRHNYLENYVSDLGNVIDMDSIRDAEISIGVDPFGEPVYDRLKLPLPLSKRKCWRNSHRSRLSSPS